MIESIGEEAGDGTAGDTGRDTIGGRRALPTVLVVSSDEPRCEALARLLPPGEFSARSTTDGAGLSSVTVEESPDIVLVDTATLPPGDAERVLEACRDLRLPTLALLSEAGLASYQVSKGPDDFLVGPPRQGELLARLRQLLWRLRGHADSSVIQAGDLIIDQNRYEVTVAGRHMLLTFKEYELLRLLASAPGKVFTREELLSRVWGYDYFGGTRTVDVHVRRLRSKVDDANHTFIETVWSVGYRFRASTTAP